MKARIRSTGPRARVLVLGALVGAAVLGGALVHGAPRAAHPATAAASVVDEPTATAAPVSPSAADHVVAAAVPPAPAAVTPPAAAERADDWTVVPPKGGGGTEVVWHAERDGISATLDKNGNIGFIRKIEPGEKPSSDEPPSPEILAVLRTLDGEARTYARAHLPTMSREEYEAMREDDEVSAVDRATVQEAKVRAALLASGAKPEEIGSGHAVVHEPSSKD